jgi:hypothetical protein
MYMTVNQYRYHGTAGKIDNIKLRGEWLLSIHNALYSAITDNNHLVLHGRVAGPVNEPSYAVSNQICRHVIITKG